MSSQSEDNSSWTFPSTVETESFTEVPAHELPPSMNVLDFSVLSRHDSIGFRSEQDTTQSCINIEASDIEDEKRAPVSIVASMDVSGSMCGKKIEDCKRTLELMLGSLKSTDHFGIITFEDDAKVLFPVCLMTPQNKELANEKIKNMHAGKGTNLSGGLALAAQEMGLINKPNAVRTIFLLTDGHANQGITAAADIKAMVRSFVSPCNKATDRLEGGMKEMELDQDDAFTNTKPSSIFIEGKTSPISLVCFGYGSDHNANLLGDIAKETSGGAYYYIKHGPDSNVFAAFGDAMGGVLSVVAQTASITISLPPSAVEKGVKILKVHHDQAVHRGNGVYTVNIGDFYAEESRDVLVEVKLANEIIDSKFPHLLVSLSYFDVIHGKKFSVGPKECLISRPDNDFISPASKHVEEQWLRIRTLEEIKAAKLEAEASNFTAAHNRLRRTIQTVQCSPAIDQFYCNAMVNELEQVQQGLQSKSAYETEGAYAMRNTLMSHSAQRSMASTVAPQMPCLTDVGPMSSTFAMYSTKRKAASARAFVDGKNKK